MEKIKCCKNWYEDYYAAINNCNIAGNSNEFIEFMLKMINETVSELLETTTQEITQEKIINIIRDNPTITQTEMAQRLGITRDGISYNIRLLKEKGVIERVGSTKKGSWRILE